MAQMERICLQLGRPRLNPWVGKLPWRRAWQPKAVLLPGESQGRRSLVGYSPRCYKESERTERLTCPHPVRKLSMGALCHTAGQLAAASGPFGGPRPMPCWGRGGCQGDPRPRGPQRTQGGGVSLGGG